MEEKNELNDIILNKGNRNSGTKKVLLAIATFSIVLIIVVVIMNRFSSKQETSLPHAPKITYVDATDVLVEPDYNDTAQDREAQQTEETNASEMETPTQEAQETETVEVMHDRPLDLPKPMFKDSQIIKEPDYEGAAQKKETVSAPVKEIKKTVPAIVQKSAEKPKAALPSGKYDPKSKQVVQTKAAESGRYYIQVGSFAKYAPSEAFLKKISDGGYTYTFHKVSQNGKTITKVLVGPFRTQSAAREALPVIKKRVISTAFLTKI